MLLGSFATTPILFGTVTTHGGLFIRKLRCCRKLPSRMAGLVVTVLGAWGVAGGVACAMKLI